MVAPNHSIQWWWCPRKSLKVCDGSKKWAKVKQSTVRLWTRLNFAVVKALLSSPFIIINNFVSLWNWICCDYTLYRSLFMSQNHRWPSHLKFVKTIEKPSLSMVNLRKNIQWWWSSGSKTIEKPSKAMVPQKKIITIPSSWKSYHRWSLIITIYIVMMRMIIGANGAPALTHSLPLPSKISELRRGTAASSRGNPDPKIAQIQILIKDKYALPIPKDCDYNVCRLWLWYLSCCG